MSDQEWCGCDGEGWAHIPGSTGFDCQSKESLKAENAALTKRVEEIKAAVVKERPCFFTKDNVPLMDYAMRVRAKLRKEILDEIDALAKLDSQEKP